MNWSQLVARAGVTAEWSGPTDPSVTSIVEDSRAAGPGCCFVAVRGTQADGHQFVDKAVAAGAVAVVCERPLRVPANVAVLQLESARGVAGRLACALTELDVALREERLKLVGITGTNGKSTFCYLAQSILSEAKRPTAMLGTVQYDTLARKIEASHTTPPSVELVGLLAEAVQAGATHAVMEVSSHALDQGRCDGLRFAVAVFSNLTGDHLDYHHDMESYLRAKKRLFDSLQPGAVAAVNVDDPAGERMIADCKARVIRYSVAGATGTAHSPPLAKPRDGAPNAPTIQYSVTNESNTRYSVANESKTIGARSLGSAVAGASEGSSTPASSLDVTARILEQSAAGTRFEVQVRKGPAASGIALTGADRCEIFTSLIGNHNVQNCLAAICAGLGVGIALETIARGLAAVQVVPGRLQRVASPKAGRAASVFVDYAHTDDALNNVLSTLKPFSRDGRLIVLFGCGGDRDRTKRPRMARAVAGWADRIILTSDNPRTEDPMRIIEDAKAGFAAEDLPRVQIDPDRRAAIELAMKMAQPGDIVLLAGKGHETYQVVGKERHPFDDAAVAAEAMGN